MLTKKLIKKIVELYDDEANIYKIYNDVANFTSKVVQQQATRNCYILIRVYNSIKNILEIRGRSRA